MLIWHPTVRKPLHRFAEWSGVLYERLTAGPFAAIATRSRP